MASILESLFRKGWFKAKMTHDIANCGDYKLQTVIFEASRHFVWQRRQRRRQGMNECVDLADEMFAEQHGLTSLSSVEKWSAVKWSGGHRKLAPLVALRALNIVGFPVILNHARYQ